MQVSILPDRFDFRQVFLTKNLEHPKVFITSEALEPVTVYLSVVVRFDHGTTTVGTESTCFHNQNRI